MFWYLIAGHFIVDYPLQGDTTAREKNRHSITDLQKCVPWFYWMFAHSIMHGLIVNIVTGSFLCGALETIFHFMIDFGKCEKWFNIHVDQALHISCKIIWYYGTSSF